MFDKVTFEIVSSEDENINEERILPVSQAYTNYYKLEEIAEYLRKFDKYIDLSDEEQVLLDKIRSGIFDIMR